MTDDIILANDLSKWYGEIIALNRFSASIGKGVTGVVGPNGSGKSTFFKIIMGLVRQSSGTIRVAGEKPWNNPKLRKILGYVPERDIFFPWMTGEEFLVKSARLSGMQTNDAKKKAKELLEIVGLAEDGGRRIYGYSRGMKQRLKIAQALIHEPEIVIMDEPMSGADPVARRKIMDIVHQIDASGRCVVISSHILYEIERMTKNVILIYRGWAVAQGRVEDIRALMNMYPHRIRVVCSNARDVAKELIGMNWVKRVGVERDNELIVETSMPNEFYTNFPKFCVECGVHVDEIRSLDDNLEAVFNYLISRRLNYAAGGERE
ncbi:MAG: hypothetical protein DRN20_00185 [Thermoplasmata archaeon]|nr:MAG: hypothetical protein DRN20_00185 [Thermoplasmata archaeon]